jgi:hypothetical protein
MLTEANTKTPTHTFARSNAMTRTTLQKFSLALALATGMLFTATVSAQSENTPGAADPSVVRGWIGEFNASFPQYVSARAIAQALADQIEALQNLEIEIAEEPSHVDVDDMQRVRRLLQLRLEELQRQYEVAQAQVNRLESMLDNLVDMINEWHIVTSESLRSLEGLRVALEGDYTEQEAFVIAILEAIDSGHGEFSRRDFRNALATLQSISDRLDFVNGQISAVSGIADAAESVVTQWQHDQARRG